MSRVFVIQKIFMNKKTGRPKLEEGHARNSLLTLRLTPQEIRRIKDEALKQGLSQSDFIRKLLQNLFNQSKV